MNQHAAPEFAMSFTQEAVLLEHRDGRGWRPLGQVRFAGRDMTAMLNALRDDAGEGTGDAMPDTIVVIPEDQILYTTLTVPVGSDTAAIIGRALEAMTPYRASDLAFDWCPSENGDIETLRVAAVARRTLDEAEDFARAQGFRPSGFVSRPGDGRFDGSPDFGPSRMTGEDSARPPFSEPDLAKARITAATIEEDRAEPAAPTEDVPAAVIISRIVAHHVPAASAPIMRGADASTKPATVQTGADPAQDVGAVSAPSARAVIRHGDRQTGPAAARLSPRAEAVHIRAAEARARRPAEDAPEVPAVSALLGRLRGIRPGRLPVLMGLLIAGLLVVLMLFGGAGDGDRLATTEVATAPQPTAPNEGAAPAQDMAQAEAMSGGASVGDDTDASNTVPDATVVDDQADATGNTGDDVATVAPAPVQDPAATAEAPAADALTRALTEALATNDTPPADTPADGAAAVSQTSQAIPATPLASDAARGDDMQQRPAVAPASEAAAADLAAPRATSESAIAAAPQPGAAAPAPASAGLSGLSRSARPPSASPTPAAVPAAPDAGPSVPSNPQPFAQRAEPEPPRVAGTRPRGRPASAPVAAGAPTASPAAASSPPVSAAPPPAAAQPLGASGRPPARPDSLSRIEEGSRAETEEPTTLTANERAFLQGLLRDLRTAQAGEAGLSQDERRILIRLADARPLRRPVAVSRPSQDAVSAAVAEAVASQTDRPASRASAQPSAAPVTASSGTLGRSARPAVRPASARVASGADPGPGNPSLSGEAVEDAIAAAVANISALPGAVALTALRTSALPPRRSGAAASPSSQASAPTAQDLRAAAEAQQRDAALADQRRQDAELQAQAEARARAQAASDAQAEARARAQAEARARAQAEAEARAAAARQQQYTPPEAENEPEVAALVPRGRGQGAADATATVKDGIQLSRTQIIGTIGAGKASRALVRLSNGRIITLRLGDKINGGTITNIGNSRITFVKGGRPQELSVLNGQ